VAPSATLLFVEFLKIIHAIASNGFSLAEALFAGLLSFVFSLHTSVVWMDDPTAPKPSKA